MGNPEIVNIFLKHLDKHMRKAFLLILTLGVVPVLGIGSLVLLWDMVPGIESHIYAESNNASTLIGFLAV